MPAQLPPGAHLLQYCPSPPPRASSERPHPSSPTSRELERGWSSERTRTFGPTPTSLAAIDESPSSTHLPPSPHPQKNYGDFADTSLPFCTSPPTIRVETRMEGVAQPPHRRLFNASLPLTRSPRLCLSAASRTSCRVAGGRRETGSSATSVPTRGRGGVFVGRFLETSSQHP
ncbi:hypothetical protein K523DRAFT_155642 [Schizophyllum commune Tattone D]|nr:hypothetical protein K523DRAFT_155642 [Schizophyllum commune Tattone D]